MSDLTTTGLIALSVYAIERLIGGMAKHIEAAPRVVTAR